MMTSGIAGPVIINKGKKIHAKAKNLLTFKNIYVTLNKLILKYQTNKSYNVVKRTYKIIYPTYFLSIIH